MDQQGNRYASEQPLRSQGEERPSLATAPIPTAEMAAVASHRDASPVAEKPPSDFLNSFAGPEPENLQHQRYVQIAVAADKFRNQMSDNLAAMETRVHAVIVQLRDLSAVLKAEGSPLASRIRDYYAAQVVEVRHLFLPNMQGTQSYSHIGRDIKMFQDKGLQRGALAIRQETDFKRARMSHKLTEGMDKVILSLERLSLREAPLSPRLRPVILEATAIRKAIPTAVKEAAERTDLHHAIKDVEPPPY